MPSYGVAEAKAKFSELIERAERGEEVVITRHGKPIVQWSRPQERKQRKPVTLEDIQRLRDSLPVQSVSSTELVRSLRDEGY